MLFTTVLLALAAAGHVFSAPVPSTGLTRLQESVDAAVERRHDILPAGAPYQRSKRLVPGWQTPEKVQRRATIIPFTFRFRPTRSAIAPPSPTPTAPFINSPPPSQAQPLAEDTEDPAEDEVPAAEDEAPAEDVEESVEEFEESAGDDGGEGTSPFQTCYRGIDQMATKTFEKSEI